MTKSTFEQRKALFLRQVAQNQRAKTPETEDAAIFASVMVHKTEKTAETLEQRKSNFVKGVRNKILDSKYGHGRENQQ